MNIRLVWLTRVLILTALAVAGCDDKDSGAGGASVTDADAASDPKDVGAVADAAADAQTGLPYCAACTADADCGPESVCLEDTKGEHYCAPLCLLSKNNCGPGATCKMYGIGADEFACQPDYGSCTGDGLPCSPCTTDTDCKDGHKCIESKMDKVRSCYKSCTTAADCPADYGCEDDLCLPFVASKYRQTCSTGQSDLCEPCTYDYDCKQGLKCGKGLHYCTLDCTKDKGIDTCPDGLFCVGSSTGGVCQPPIAYKCQGWLGCAFDCEDKNQVCDRGWCRDP